MEDEQNYFYQSQLDFFGEKSNNNAYNPMRESQDIFNVNPLVSSPERKDSTIQQQNSVYFKAYNPLEQFKNIPQDKHHSFELLFNNYKTLTGIQHFFNFGQEDQHRSQFLQNVDSDAFGDNTNNNLQLDKLFIGENRDNHNAHRQQIQNTLHLLNKKIQDINQKTIGSVNFNKTVSNAFYEHFQNFALVMSSSKFLAQFETNFKSMLGHCRKIKGPGIDLVVSIYEFWMKSFKQFVNEIGKYSSKFTLNFFKKNQPHDADSCNNYSHLSDIRSQSSNTMGSKDKRKGWTREQTEYLQKCIDDNIIFTQSVLKTLAAQFNRSVSSISSKIQKLIKSKKGEETQQDSLLRKTIQILKIHQEGLTRQSIVDKINQNYQMGYGGQWQRSVGQLLSSKKEFLRIRGKHKLLNPTQYKPLQTDNDERSKLTFKDKVIQIFLTLPNTEGDLKTLVDKYNIMFGDAQIEGQGTSQQRRKTIEGNISKTLSRYDIFDSSNAKTRYLLNPLMNTIEARDMDMQVENFFTL